MQRRPHPIHLPTPFLTLLDRGVRPWPGVTADRWRRLPEGVE